MAIVPMNKIFIAGMLEDKKSIFSTLLKLGCVQIEEFKSEDIEKYSDIIKRTSETAEINDVDGVIFDVQNAIRALSEYDTKKKSLFSSQSRVSNEKYSEIKDNCGILSMRARKICEYLKDLNDTGAEKNHKEHEKALLSAYEKCDIPLDFNRTKFSSVLLGSIPAFFDINEIKAEMTETVGEAELFLLSDDSLNHYVYIIYHNSCEEGLTALLEQKGFSKLNTENLHGTVSNNMERIDRECKAIEKKAEDIKSKISSEAAYLDDFKIFYDYLLNDKECLVSSSNALETSSVFMINGFIPKPSAEKLQKKLTNKFKNIIIEISEPEEGEETPVLFKNNRFVEPFEMVTELYSLPGPKDIDPNPSMSIFYFVFFGLMLSDAGYGIVLMLLSYLLLWKMKPKGTMGKLLRLLFFGGLSTTVWGVMFGGWFGDLFAGINMFKPIWINPIKEPMTLLLWSLAFGVIHLFTGMGIKAYMLIRDGDIKSAVFDIGLWYVFLIGLGLLLIGSPAGKVMSLIGGIGLVLTQGRSEKNIFKKFTSGLLSLYDITGYISDILSYSRLLALGLATGVIAQVINTMGRLVATNVFGVIIFIIILIVGHVFNLAINTLGSYVHASRLQYVEYFGKFYTGGGKAFAPLKQNNKYTQFTEQ